MKPTATSCATAPAPMLVMPHQVEAEQSVIGLSIVNGIVPPVPPADFYDSCLGTIAAALVEMARADVPIEAGTVYDWLLDHGQLEGVGGQALLRQLTEGMVQTLDNECLDVYAGIIREKARARRLLRWCQETITRAGTTPPADWNKWVTSGIAEVVQFAEKHNGNGKPPTLSEGITATIAEMERRMASGDALIGIPTGLTDLDTMTSGLVAGDLVVIAGRPSMGKSALALDVARTAAGLGKRVVFFSLEMPMQALLMRLLASESGHGLHGIRTGRMAPRDAAEVIKTASRLLNLPLTIDDTPGLTELEICQRAMKHQPDMVVVDYLGLVRPSRETDNRARDVGRMAAAFKNLAKKMSIPVVLLAQLNRENEKGAKKPRPPRLSDLRESGEIEQHADVVIFSHAETKDAEYRDLLIEKQRMGPTGKCRAAWLGEITSFRDWIDETAYTGRKEARRHAD